MAMNSPMGRPPLQQTRRANQPHTPRGRLRVISGRFRRGNNNKMLRMSDRSSSSNDGSGQRRRSSGSNVQVRTGGGYPTAAVFGGVLVAATVVNVTSLILL